MTPVIVPVLEPVTDLRLLAAAHPGLEAHLRRHGRLPQLPGAAIIAELEHAGLTGRGGARFPVHRKLAAVAAAAGRRHRPVVVANGAEGEPASAKDRTLMSAGAHLVLDGLQITARAVDADRAVLHVGASSVAVAGAAVAERRAAGIDAIAVEIVEAAPGFLSGEESAAVAHIDGRPALPRDKALRVVESGVGGRPTLVQNVETLAHVALVARYGASRFRTAGTPEEPGTMLITLTGAVTRPGVREVALGTELAELIDGAGPVLVGGFHGAWLTATEAASGRLSWSSLRQFDAAPGAGVLFALPPHVCGVAETARIVGYLAGSSARQCGPCRNGLPAMAATLGRLADGERDQDLVARTHGLATLVTGRGACHHPDGTARFVRSALRVFAADVDAHLHGHCLAQEGRP